MRDINDITGQVVDAAYHLHRQIGPGLFESVYEAILARALEKRGLQAERQKSIAFEYDEIRFDDAFRGPAHRAMRGRGVEVG